jgi:hypothetical protein
VQIYDFPKNVKKQANIALNAAIRRKEVVPLDYCEICYYDLEMLAEVRWEEIDLPFFKKSDINASHLISGHHYNYNYPLSVWWLCIRCHAVLHALQRKLKIACIGLQGARDLINQNRDFYNKTIQVEESIYIQEEFY